MDEIPPPKQSHFERPEILDKPIQKFHMEKDLSSQEPEKKEEKEAYKNEEKG